MLPFEEKRYNIDLLSVTFTRLLTDQLTHYFTHYKPEGLQQSICVRLKT